MLKGILAAVAGLAVVAGLVVFEPWRAVTDSTVDEALPTSAPADVGESSAPVVDEETVAVTPTPTPTPAPEAAAPPGPVEVARGSFVDAEHGTEGVARVLQLADGSRYLRLEGLDTSDGPDLHVWLSDQPSGGSWASYDDGRHLRLGELKANHGNHNYPIPAEARLDGLTTAVIWCDRFNVAFGTAPLALA